MIPTDVGAFITVGLTVAPVASAAATINGTGVDRDTIPGGKRYLSGVLAVKTGAVTGAPGSQTVDASLQDSADNSSFAAVSPAVAITTLTTANAVGLKKFDATMMRRYLRAVVVVAFVGGTSPTIGVDAAIVLGGPDFAPTGTP